MHLPKSHIGISQHQQHLSRRSLSSAVLWSLRCLLVGLLCFCFQRSMLLLADNSLVTQEIRYHMPEAGEVFLVWGINGWAIAPEENRPPGTVVKDGVMHTPMAREGDTFVVQLQVPAGATIDYGFLITKTRNDVAIETWEANGEQDYHTIATQDGVLEVQTKLTLAEDQTPATAFEARLPLLIGISIVLAISIASTARRVSAPLSLKTWLHGQRTFYLYDLLRELVARDMKLRYKRSILGIVWSLLNPLFQMLVFVFLSRRVLSLDIPNYPAFVFTGVLAWNWFQSTVVTMTSAITGNRELVRRPGFPVAILPVVTVTTNLIHFLLALPVPLLFLLLGGGRLTPTLLALPFVIGLQFLLILGLGYLAATANVTFRDTQHLLVVFFMLLFYLTPVFYDANAVPARYHVLYRLNPMFHLITAYRAILIQGELPDFRALLPLAALVGVLLWLGHSVFQRASYRFVEEL
jgi:lipopolysaccharide transport system permease protein